MFQTGVGTSLLLLYWQVMWSGMVVFQEQHQHKVIILLLFGRPHSCRSEITINVTVERTNWVPQNVVRATTSKLKLGLLIKCFGIFRTFVYF